MLPAQSAVGQFTGADASLNFYLLTQPADARAVQDEIYSLKVAEMKAADEQAKKQAEDVLKKQSMEQVQKEQPLAASGNFTFEGSWYDASTPKQYFVGGASEPDCDYEIKKNGGHWSIANHCPNLKRSIDRVDVQAGQLRFRLTGHDPAFPYSRVTSPSRYLQTGRSWMAGEPITIKRTLLPAITQFSGFAASKKAQA